QLLVCLQNEPNFLGLGSRRLPASRFFAKRTHTVIVGWCPRRNEANCSVTLSSAKRSQCGSPLVCLAKRTQPSWGWCALGTPHRGFCKTNPTLIAGLVSTTKQSQLFGHAVLCKTKPMCIVAS